MDSPAQGSLTLVTGFWLQKHEHVRTTQVYVSLFEELVRHIDGVLPIVCCVDPRIENQVRSIQDRHPTARLEIRPAAFEDLHFAHGRERFADLQPATNSFTLRDTIEYAIIVWSKAHTVLGVAKDNPFKTGHFAWIDFGIPHVAELLDVDWREIERTSTATTNLRIAERMATSPSEVADPCFFYSNNAARVCGGFFTGTRDRFAELASLFESEVERMIPTGTYALEEQVLAAVSALKTDTVDRWYTDYQGVLTNVSFARHDTEIIMENLAHCRKSELFENGSDIACYLLESGERHLHLLPEQCLHLLDDGLACTIHYDEDLARLLASSALSLYHYTRIGRGMMKGTWRKSLQQSLKEIDLDFPAKPWTWEEFTAHPTFRVWLSCL